MRGWTGPRERKVHDAVHDIVAEANQASIDAEPEGLDAGSIGILNTMMTNELLSLVAIELAALVDATNRNA